MDGLGLALPLTGRAALGAQPREALVTFKLGSFCGNRIRAGMWEKLLALSNVLGRVVEVAMKYGNCPLLERGAMNGAEEKDSSDFV